MSGRRGCCWTHVEPNWTATSTPLGPWYSARRHPARPLIAAEPSEGPWIDLTVGSNTQGPVFELELEDGWQDVLSACVLAVIEGRYSFRRRKARLGWIETMDFGPGEFSPGKVKIHDLTGEPSSEEIARYSAY